MKKYVSVLFLLLSLMKVMAQQNTMYVVKKGETLQTIAKIKRLSVSDILRLNPDVRAEVREGTILILPQSYVTHYNNSEADRFTFYVVKSKETLFDIARRYGVSMDDLKRYNQALYTQTLKVGDTLTIPSFKKSKEVFVLSNTPQLKKYVVQAYEGLWRIAQNHNITVSDLLKLNPGISENVKEGQDIWVPASESENKLTSPIQPEKYATYTIEKAEGFYSLNKKFGLSEKELIELNPQLKEGVRVNTEIRIPIKNYQKYIKSVNDNWANDTYKLYDKELKIAYLLPFKTDKLLDKEEIKEKMASDKLMQIATDFYLGSQIALDSLYKKGYKFSVEVFDSSLKQDVERIKTEYFDAIIGAFSPKVTNAVSSEVSDSTLIFSPLSNGRDLQLRQNVYQTLPSTDTQKEAMLDYLSSHYQQDNVLMISDFQGSKDHSLIFTKLPQIRVIPNSEKETIESFLKKNEKNIIIININEITHLIKTLQNLYAIASQSKMYQYIRVVTLDRTALFDSNNISLHHLSQLHFTFPSPSRFSNRNTPFLLQFEKEYGVIPNRYVIRGYDITTDVLKRLLQEDKTAQIDQSDCIENIFEYRNNPYRGAGQENKAVYILEYNQLEIKELK